MKYSVMPLGVLVLLMLACLSSCESDPDIMNDNAPNALIVWGYADMQSGLHQVRIREAIQEEGNVYELAQDPELALPTDPLLVQLILYTPPDNTVMETLEMNPVIYPKDEGIFSDEQNVIHEVEYQIPKGFSCSLQITNLVTDEIITSSIVNAIAPGFTYPIRSGWFVPKYYFNSAQNPFHIKFNIQENLVHKLATELKYVDLTVNGDTVCRKAIFEGNPIYAGGAFDEYTRTFPPDYLLNIFKQVIPVDPDVKLRWFYRFNFISLAASTSLRNYLQLGDRFNDNRKLNFSNISGGYGLFYACDHKETGDIEPTHSFPETLSKAPEILDLNFSRYIYMGTYKDPDHE